MVKDYHKFVSLIVIFILLFLITIFLRIPFKLTFISILQGLFEWLPISSSGTVMIVAINFFGISPEEAFSLAIWLHLGTSFAVILKFRKEFIEIFKACLPIIYGEPEEIIKMDRKRPQTPADEYAPFKPDEDLVPPMARFGEGYHVHVTGLTHDQQGYPKTNEPEIQCKLVHRLCGKIKKNADKIIKTHEFMLDDAEVTVIAYGITSRAAVSAVKKARMTGKKVGLLRLVTLWPFPEKRIEEISDRSKAIIVPEMNCGQIVREVERVAKDTPVHFLSKIGGEPPNPSEIAEVIRRTTTK